MINFGLLLCLLIGTQGSLGSGFTSITVSSSVGRSHDTGQLFNKVSCLEFESFK